MPDHAILKTLRNSDERIILFGAASRGRRVIRNLEEHGIERARLLVCDNNEKIWNKKCAGVRIMSLQELEQHPRNVRILVSSSMFTEIIQQLRGLGFKNVSYVHSLLFAERNFEKYDPEFLRIKRALGNRCYLDDDEKFSIYSSVKATRTLAGYMAEVGVYKGGSAKLICEVKNNKKLFLFDTFEGLPDSRERVDESVKSGWLSDTDLESVKRYLRAYKKVYFRKGVFPDSAKGIDQRFCFVHCDTDMYEGTLASLNFFWPRMVRGGRLICHDYNGIKGVQQAVDEFFKDDPARIIEIADSQALMVK